MEMKFSKSKQLKHRVFEDVGSYEVIKKPKKLSLTKEKKKAWVAFSKYIRIRDCYFTTKSMNGVCVTCGRTYPFNQLQAGHFLPGRKNIALFDEEQVNAQCYGCNIGKKGNWANYLYWMDNKYGEKRVKDMLAHRNDVIKYTVQDYIDFTKRFTKQYETIEKTMKQEMTHSL